MNSTIRKVSIPLPIMGGLGLLVCGLVGGTVYNLQQVRELEAELAEMRLSVDRVKSRPAGPSVETAQAATTATSAGSEEIDALRTEMTRVQGELARMAERQEASHAAVPPLAAETAQAAPAETQAAPAGDQVHGILASLESQDQALLKGVVKEILEQQEVEEREARRKRESEEMIRQMAQLLSLTPEQSTRVSALLAERMKAMEALRTQSNDQNRDDLRAKMQEVRKQGEEQLATFLTADQLTKYKEWTNSREGQRWGGGGRGPEGGGRGGQGMPGGGGQPR